MRLPDAETLKQRWEQVLGDAKIAWGKFTDDELLQLEGQEQRLSGLIAERYAITADQASRQARNFFQKHMA